MLFPTTVCSALGGVQKEPVSWHSWSNALGRCAKGLPSWFFETPKRLQHWSLCPLLVHPVAGGGVSEPAPSVELDSRFTTFYAKKTVYGQVLLSLLKTSGGKRFITSGFTLAEGGADFP